MQATSTLTVHVSLHHLYFCFLCRSCIPCSSKLSTKAMYHRTYACFQRYRTYRRRPFPPDAYCPRHQLRLHVRVCSFLSSQMGSRLRKPHGALAICHSPTWIEAGDRRPVAFPSRSRRSGLFTARTARVDFGLRHRLTLPSVRSKCRMTRATERSTSRYYVWRPSRRFFLR